MEKDLFMIIDHATVLSSNKKWNQGRRENGNVKAREGSPFPSDQIGIGASNHNWWVGYDTKIDTKSCQMKHLSLQKFYLPFLCGPKTVGIRPLQRREEQNREES